MQTGQTKNGTGMTVSACLWLGLFPLLQFGSYAHITYDKWVLMWILLGLTATGFLVDLFRHQLARPRWIPLLAGGGLLLCMLISCLASPYPGGIWWIGVSARREGLMTQLCYLALFFLFSFSRVRVRPVLYSACGGVMVYLVIVLLQWGGINVFGLYPAGRSYADTPEFQGPIGNVDMVAGYLCLLSGLFLPACAGSRRILMSRPAGLRSRMPFLCPFLGLLASFFLILTMGVLFSLLTLGVLAGALLISLAPRKTRVLALAVLIVLVFLVIWFWPASTGGMWEIHEILQGRPQLSFGSNRLALLKYGLALAGSGRLLTGTGSDTFSLRFSQYLQAEGITLPDRQGSVLLPHSFDNPHNEYLAHLLNHGLFALLCFVGIILSVLIRKRHVETAETLPWRGGVFCYAVQAFFSFSVCMVAPMFWVVLGLAASEK